MKLTFGLLHFVKFLNNNSIFAFMISALLTERLNDLISCIMNDLIIPIINIDTDGDGQKDIKIIENKKLNFFGIRIKIGKFITCIIKFILVFYLIFFMSKIGNYFYEKLQVEKF